MFLAGIMPAIIVLVLRTSIPESPRWLMKQGKPEEAMKSLETVVGSPVTAGNISKESQNCTNYGKHGNQ